MQYHQRAEANGKNFQLVGRKAIEYARDHNVPIYVLNEQIGWVEANINIALKALAWHEDNPDWPTGELALCIYRASPRKRFSPVAFPQSSR